LLDLRSLREAREVGVQEDFLHYVAPAENLRQRTAELIRETDVAPLSALRVGQVEVVQGQTLLAIMPFVEAWWMSAAFWLRETVQKDDKVFGGGAGGKVVVVKEESGEVAAQTTRQGGARTKCWRWPWPLFQCH
jgi:hypothetical protein